MPRPATGRTPDKDRTAKSRGELVKAGGRRLDMRLPPDAAEHLRLLKSEGGHKSDTEAIVAMLADAVKRRRRTAAK